MGTRVPLRIIYTGNGKGKTTAAMGLLLRTLGHNKSCAVLQFIKPDSLETGEKRFCRSQGVVWENYGEGFLWNVKDETASREACIAGWERAKVLIGEGRYELLVLDEFTYALNKGFVDTKDVVEYLDSLPEGNFIPHVVITGRDASPLLMESADMVHEIVEIKHPWRTGHVQAQPCIEY